MRIQHYTQPSLKTKMLSSSTVFRFQTLSFPQCFFIQDVRRNWVGFFALQRGHQNSLEMMPMYFLLMILGGMKHPCICAALGLLYNVSRFFYFKGYSTGDPMKRLTIGFVFFFLFLFFLCFNKL